jgi:hypothetical protein
MKNLFILLFSSLFLSLYSQSGSIIKNEKIDNSILVKILNNSQIKYLNEIDPNSPRDLDLRLYSISQDIVVYGTEQMIKNYDYYLAVSEHGENPEQAVFYLGKFGELTNIIWGDYTGSDTATIILDILNYPKYLLELDPNLKKSHKKVKIEITINDIKIIK